MTDVFEKPEDLSGYLFRITDNGGSTADRYTVTFSDGSYLCLSSSPSHPLGVSQSGEDMDPATLEEWVEDGEAVDLALGDLPEGLVRHVMFRNNEGLRDFLEAIEARDPKAVAPSREAARDHEGLSTSLGDGIYATPGGLRVKVEGDGDENDMGPFATAREALLATLPDVHSLSGPEYHSGVDDVMRMEPSEEVLARVAELEARRQAESSPSRGM